MSLRATCHECSKTYKVPHDRKGWHCKECDGVLSLESDEAQVDPEPSGTPCNSCGALNFGDGAFCEECGEELAAPHSERSRKNAAHDMRRSMKRINRLKSWVGLNLILTLLATAGLVLVLSKTEGLSGGEVALLAGIQLLILGLSYAAYRFLDLSLIHISEPTRPY